MKNNVSFGFLNFQTIAGRIYYIYGMLIGVETKVLVAFTQDRPLSNENIRETCLSIYNMYLGDVLNPFNSIGGGVSPGLLAKLQNHIAGAN